MVDRRVRWLFTAAAKSCRTASRTAMSLYKVTARLNGTAVDDSDEEEEEEAVQTQEPEPEPEEEEDDDEDEEDEEDAAAEEVEEAAGLTQEEKDERAKRRRWDREFEEQHFISRRKAANGKFVYFSTLIEDSVTFFRREDMVNFTKGKAYKRLLYNMKVGMRTNDELEKRKAKAEARRERKRPEREAKAAEKRKRRRIGKGAEDIEKRKAAFQQKKARRMARKAAAQAT